MSQSDFNRASAPDQHRRTGLEDRVLLAAVTARLFGQRRVPTRLERYELSHELGRGAQSVVWAAWDPRLQRKVAIKLARRDTYATGGDETHERLASEAVALAKLQDPHVVEVYDIGTFADRRGVFIVMAHVGGASLEQWLALQPRSWREVVHKFVAAGEGLVALHRHGLVHRDFKPSNVLLTVDGEVKLADLGLVRHFEHDRATTNNGAAEPSVGTPLYMAPEQHRTGAVGPQADQYAFCVALFEALRGRPPFATSATSTVLEAKLCGALDLSGAGKLPSALVRAIARGLAVTPEARHPDMSALLGALRRLLSGGRSTRRAVFASCCAAAVGVASWTPDPESSCAEVVASALADWNPEARERLEASFAATGLPYAGEAARRTIARLDAYGRAWGDAREALCQTEQASSAARVAVESERHCLESRGEAWRALVHELEHADARVVERAADAVAKLEPISTCATEPARAIPEPIDRPEEKQLRSELGRIAAMMEAGRTDLASARAREAVATAQRVGNRRLLALALDQRGVLASELGRLKDAEADERDAYFLAFAAGDEQQAFTSALHLAFDVGARGRRHDEARQWLLLAAALASGAQAEVKLLAAQADHAGQIGEVELAAELALRALEQQRELDPEHPRVAALMNNAAMWLSRMRRLDDARALFEDALQRTREVHGEHPGVARTLDNLARVELRAGELDAADRLFREALDVRLRALGETHLEVAVSRANLGQVAHERGHVSEAREYYVAALVGFEHGYGEDHRNVAELLNNLGYVELDLEQPEAARVHFDRAITIYERTVGPSHPIIAHAEVGLGHALLLLDRPRDAIAPLEQAKRRLEESQSARYLAGSMFLLAQALWGANEERRRALELATEAAQIFAAGDDPSDPERHQLVVRWLKSRGAPTRGRSW